MEDRQRSKKRVLILVDTEYGGVATSLIALLKAIDKRYVDVTLVGQYPFGPRYQEIACEYAVSPIVLNTFNLLLLGKSKAKSKVINVIFRVLRKLLRICSTKKNNLQYRLILMQRSIIPKGHYDAVLDFLGYGRLTTAISTLISSPLKATWIHDENISFIDDSYSYYKKFSKMFCVSNAVARKVIEQYPEFSNKVEVFHNIIDPSLIVKKSSIPFSDSRYKGRNKILTIGRLVPQKGIDLAIQTATLLKKSNIDFHWYVLGDGYDRISLERLIIQNDITDCFILLGYVNNPDNYLQQCDIYVQPSRSEGQAITVSEAIILKKPIIVSDIPSLREQITDRYNGLVCSLSSEDLANSIIEIMEDEELRYHLVKNLALQPPLYISGDLIKLYKYLGVSPSSEDE